MISNSEIIYSKLRMFSYKPAATPDTASYDSVDVLSTIKGAIDDICSDKSMFVPPADVALGLARRRADTIATLRTIKQDLDTLMKFVDNKLEISSQIYSHEVAAMNKFIHSGKHADSPTMTVVNSAHGNTAESRNTEESTSAARSKSLPPGLSTLVDRPCSLLYAAPRQVSAVQSIMITPALSLKATVISNQSQLREENCLYYIPSTNHFAFKLFGRLFHGNIGTIYTSETYTPEKIKDCKFAANCTKGVKCDYYHDPLKFAGSRDVRNFIATSWLYSPFNRSGRVFGSRPNLDLDILKVTPDDLSRLHDQLAHDFLCLMLLWSATGADQN